MNRPPAPQSIPQVAQVSLGAPAKSGEPAGREGAPQAGAVQNPNGKRSAPQAPGDPDPAKAQ